MLIKISDADHGQFISSDSLLGIEGIGESSEITFATKGGKQFGEATYSYAIRRIALDLSSDVLALAFNKALSGPAEILDLTPKGVAEIKLKNQVPA